MTLYHYTCADHGHAGLGDQGILVPGQARSDTLTDYWPASFVWLTDLDKPLRGPLGLTMQIPGSCDRTTHRYRVLDESNVFRWTLMRRTVLGPEMLEQGDARPVHWFVSLAPVPVVYDPVSLTP